MYEPSCRKRGGKGIEHMKGSKLKERRRESTPHTLFFVWTMCTFDAAQGRVLLKKHGRDQNRDRPHRACLAAVPREWLDRAPVAIG